MMKSLNKNDERTEHTYCSWYYWLGIICSLEILNIAFTDKIAPAWLTTLISILFVAIMCYYIKVLFSYLNQIHKTYLAKIECNLCTRIDNLEQINSENIQLLSDNIEKQHANLLIKNDENNLKLQAILLDRIELLNAVIEKELKVVSHSLDSGFELNNKNTDAQTNSLINIINKEFLLVKESQNAIEHLMEDVARNGIDQKMAVELFVKESQEQVKNLQTHIIEEIIAAANSLNQTYKKGIEDNCNLLEGKFGDFRMQVIRLNEILNKKIDVLNKNAGDNFVVLNKVEKLNASINKNIDGMIANSRRSSEKDAIYYKDIGVKNEAALNKMAQIESQIVKLNAIVKSLASTKPEKIQGSETRHDLDNDKETIEDVESGIKVINTLLNNLIVHSEMFQDGIKVFDADYDNSGNILSSRNYNKNGDTTTEMSYYQNGQVKERKEITIGSSGSEIRTTNFDINGNKI